jgi:hypothetical protein
MVLTLADIRGQIARLLRDNGINSAQFGPDAVTAAVKMACDDFCKKTGSTYQEEDLQAAMGIVTLPDGLITIVRAFHIPNP